MSLAHSRALPAMWSSGKIAPRAFAMTVAFTFLGRQPLPSSLITMIVFAVSVTIFNQSLEFLKGVIVEVGRSHPYGDPSRCD